MAQVDMFLKLDGIDGESHDHKHKGEIEVLSFSFGLSVREAANNPDRGARPTFEDLTIVKSIDTTSPKLMLACVSGHHFKYATFEILPAVQDPAVAPSGNAAFYKLTDVIIGSIHQTGSEHGSEFPTEEVALDFAHLETFEVGPISGGPGQ
jgi:type VI secretion system secreted protein Hcp